MTDTVPFRWGVHDVERNLTLLGKLGIHQCFDGVRCIWKRIRQRSAAIEGRLKAAGLQGNQKLVGINAGSVWATKRWLPEGFAAVADRIAGELGAQVLFIGGAKDRELIEKILGLMKTPALNWAGSRRAERTHRGHLPLRRISDQRQRADAYRRRLCGFPTVAIFGPTTREFGIFSVWRRAYRDRKRSVLPSVRSPWGQRTVSAPRVILNA